MAISARNQIAGTITAITLGSVMAEVVLDCSGMEIVAAITRHSVETLDLKVGDTVTAVVKATEVMVMR